MLGLNSPLQPSILPRPISPPQPCSFPSLSFPLKTHPRGRRNLLLSQNNTNNNNNLTQEQQPPQEPKQGSTGNNSGINGGNGDDDGESGKDQRPPPLFNVKWSDLLFDPDPDNILAVGLAGLLTWASVQVLWQLFFISLAILVAALKYSFIAALLIFILITLL